MKNLSIELNQDYRSFKNELKVSLNGDLVVLSGINGSGKSQLIDVISQRERRDDKKAISATIKIDDIQINRNNILRRSFKDNVNVPELTHAGTGSITSHKNHAWNAYRQYRLDFNNTYLWDYKESSEWAKKVLIKEYGDQKFNNSQITEIEFKDTIPPNFVWKSDDIFTNFIGELFFNYAVDVYDAQAEAGRDNKKFDPTTLPISPWKQLNDLFFELGFEYRFKDDYFVKSFQINEQPNLYQIKSDGNVDESESRKLSDLSDGEKAIISLSFASLSGVKHEDRKILLLDEFDANFNPSLTKVFYKILNRYFISQGILVIIATHSPTTISLAPDNTSFYEMFKQSVKLSARILPVQKDDYTELQIANKTFYARISDQASRIIELEKQKIEFDTRVGELQKQTKTLLFVEGEIDIQYLNKSIKFYPEWKQALDNVEIKEKNGKGNLSKYWKGRLQIKEFLKYPVILLFDCDTNQIDDQDSLIYKRCIPIQNMNSIKDGIENLFYDDLIIKAEKSRNKKCVKKSIPDADKEDKQEWRVIDDEKKNLADWICANAEKNDFTDFKVIFDIINQINQNVTL